MNEKLLFLGIDSATRFAIEYAKSLGVYTIVTDFNTPEKRPEKLLADEYWMIDVTDIDTLEEKCRTEHVTGIFGGNVELCLETVRVLTKRLGLPFYASDEGWACSRDKGLFKEYCQKAGLDVPRRYRVNKPITSEMLADIHFPVMIKPVDAAASKGVTTCTSIDEFEKSYDYALQFSESGDIIVEDFIAGNVVIAFFYLEEGKAHLTHVNCVIDTKVGGNPTNSGSVVVKQREYAEYIQKQYGDRFQKLFSSMNCKHGNVFVQGFLCNGKYYIFEMGYRLDGLCDFTVTKPLYGFSAMESFVDFALGRKYPYNGESHLNTGNDRIGVLSAIWGNPGVIREIVGEDVLTMDGVGVGMARFKVGDEILPTKNMLQMAYYISIVTDSKEKLIEKIKEINSRLAFLDENKQNLLVPFERFDDLRKLLS